MKPMAIGFDQLAEARIKNLSESQSKIESKPDKSEESLRKVAKQFESLFYEMMLKEMRKTVPKDGLVDGGNAEDIYQSMLDGEYAKIMANSQKSQLSEKMVEQLTQARTKAQKLTGQNIYSQQAQASEILGDAKE